MTATELKNILDQHSLWRMRMTCEICGMAIDPAADSAWDRPALDWPAAHEQCAAEAAAGLPVERNTNAAYRRMMTAESDLLLLARLCQHGRRGG
jgi:hypothetical protein